MKKCSKCHIKKDLSGFHKDKSTKDGYTYSCNECRRKVKLSKGPIKYNYDPDKERWRRILKHYGITEDIYNKMLKDQGGVCAICKQEETVKHPNGKVRDLSVDHCHTTGIVRGLLCNKCNQAIGLFRDDIKLLGNAVIYLNNYESKIAI